MTNVSYIIIATFLLVSLERGCYDNPSALYYSPHCVRACHSDEGLDDEGSPRRLEHGMADISLVYVIMFSSKYMIVIKAICSSSIIICARSAQQSSVPSLLDSPCPRASGQPSSLWFPLP